MGCPNRFRAPTLMIATSGRNTASASAVTAPALPWWPTLITSMSPTAPSATSRSSTSPSASPVVSIVAFPARRSITRLESFSEASSTGPVGDSTSTEQPPTANSVPAGASMYSASKPRAASATSPEATAEPCVATTCSTATTPASPPTAEKWSACGWVIKSESSRRTPCRDNAALSADSLGPTSTSAAESPLWMRMASPCPTSSTVTVACDGPLGPTTVISETTIRARASTFATHRRGCGHHTHSPTAAPMHTSPAHRADHPSMTAAPGTAANFAASHTVNPPIADAT